VLVPLVVIAGEVHTVFIRRHASLRHHAGQYAFAGGRRDGDETPAACALRECEEELGLPRTAIDVLGALPARATSLGYLVQPLVGALPGLDGLRPQAAEVDLVLPVPLAALADAGRWRLQARPGAAAPTPAFTFAEHVVWGLTARVARDLLERLP